MNDATLNKTSTEFVFRRLSDPLHLFGQELPPQLWWVVLGLVLFCAFFYVGWMYLKDSRGVGPYWATFLGLLRTSVYIVLALVFLLPARQVVEESTDKSRVFLLLDASGSMTDTRDDLPEPGKKFTDLLTRQEKVLAFLKKNDFAFINGLLETNPVTPYRFGTRIDEDFVYLTSEGDWTREEWEARLREVDISKRKRGDKLSLDYWSAWLLPNRPIELKNEGIAGPADEPKEFKSRLARLAEHNAKFEDAGVFKATNVTQATLDLLTREMNKMVQGIIVVTDGRNTSTISSETLLRLEERARSAKIPIFVVGVGSDRPQIRIEVADLRAPKIIRPEDSFKAVVELTGMGLADQPANVVLDVARVNTTKEGKEELLDVVLVEAETKGNKEKAKEEIVLGKKLVLQPVEPVKFDRNSPPRVTAEFQFDAVSLALAAGVDLNSDKHRGRKWEIAEGRRGVGKEGDELVLQGRIAADHREIFPGTPSKDVLYAMPVLDKDREKMLPLHLSEKNGVQVIRKPLQVLMFASGAMRDYQFARTLLVREMEKERVMLSIYLQPPPGTSERRTGIVQDVPGKHFLEAFPENFDQPADDEDAKLKDLSTYDVILAFDPDWTQLTEKQLQNVLKWVDRGGGLVVIGGPINTLQLARPGANKDKLKPILELYPVELKDIRIDEGDRKPDRPWPLSFEGATPEMEFLKLSDEVERGGQPFLSDWLEFWGQNKDNPDKTAVSRGIFNYYPVEKAKVGTQVVARFMDPQAKTKEGDQMPYIVTTDPHVRRVVWIGSGEMWRLRQYKETFHERFWTKMIRFAGSANAGKNTKRISIYLGRTYPARKYAEFEAKIDGKGGVPLSAKARPPEITIKVPAGVNPKEIPNDLTMKPKPGSEGWWTGRFQVRTPGPYELEVRVPETNDTTPPQKFIVTPSNPELDDTRPDFDLMYRMASEADLVLPRMEIAAQQELRKRLTRPVLSDTPSGDKPNGKDDKLGDDPKQVKNVPNEDKMRLYFDLSNADLIPSCMKADSKTARSLGPVTDQWDDGFELWHTPPDAPVKLSYILLTVVGLLSIEWLTRKLLRLA